MKNRKALLAIVAVVVVAVVGWLIYRAYVSPREEVIKIGAILPLTGDLSSYGVDTRKALELGVEEINRGGGVQGKKIALMVEDSRGVAAQAVNAFTKLVDVNGVVGILGPITSAEVLSVAPIANAKKIPIISPSATSPDVSDAGEYVFRTINADEVETQVFAHYVKNELNIDLVGIIAVDAAGTISYANSFERFFTALNGRVVSKEIVSEAATEYRSPIRKVLQKRPKAVYVSGYSKEIGLIIKQIREIDKEVVLLSYQSAEDRRVLELAGSAVDGLIFSSTTLPEGSLGKRHEEFVASFKERFGKEPGVFTAEIYDALYVLVEALRRSQATGSSLLTSLSQTHNYDGASGPITFDQKGDVHKPVAVYKYTGTTISLLKIVGQQP
jgi:branched-chain amino acid transport system substrate-binding protein